MERVRRDVVPVEQAAEPLAVAQQDEADAAVEMPRRMRRRLQLLQLLQPLNRLQTPRLLLPTCPPIRISSTAQRPHSGVADVEDAEAEVEARRRRLRSRRLPLQSKKLPPRASSGPQRTSDIPSSTPTACRKRMVASVLFS